MAKNTDFFFIFLILYTCKRAQGQLQRSSPVAIQFILPEAEIILTLILLLITFLKKCCNLFSYNNYKLSTDIEYFFVPSWTEKCTLVIWGHTRSNKMGPQLPPIYIGSGHRSLLMKRILQIFTKNEKFCGAPIYYLLGVEENINFGFTSHMADAR